MHREIKKDRKTTNSILSFTMLEILKLKGFHHCFYKIVIKNLLQSLLSFSHCANHNAEQTSFLRLGKRLGLSKRRLFYSFILQVFKSERTLENSIQASFWPASITLAHFPPLCLLCLPHLCQVCVHHMPLAAYEQPLKNGHVSNFPLPALSYVHLGFISISRPAVNHVHVLPTLSTLLANFFF